MLTDIEIAQRAKMRPIVEIARKLDLGHDDIELYGQYKAKVHADKVLARNGSRGVWCWSRASTRHPPARASPQLR
jgi:formyltetrahydrofolate synthetase